MKKIPRNIVIPSKTILIVLIALFLGSCSEGGGGSAPDNDGFFTTSGAYPFDTGIAITVDGDEQTEVSKFGSVNVLKDLPNSQQPVVTATFVDFEQNVIRPDREEDEALFVEECVLSEPIIDPVMSLASTVKISVGGNTAAGDELYLNDSNNAPYLTMNKIVSGEDIGYVVRIPSLDILPESLTLDIPGDTFPAVSSVIIPRVDPIKDFAPAPGSVIDNDTSFTWTMMDVDSEQGTVFMDITIINENSTLNCVVLDDGAFSISDGLVLFGDETFDGGILAVVTRKTRHDTAADDAHIIATNVTSIAVERTKDEPAEEVFTGEYLGADAAATPPELVNPVLYQLTPGYPTSFVDDFDRVGCSGLIHRINIPPGQDAFISMSPGSGALQYPLWVSGGRNVHIQGLEFRTVVQPGCDVGEAHQVRNNIPNIHPRLPGSKVLRFEQSGTTFIEGVDIDLAGQEADCFVMRNPAGTTIAQALSNRKVAIVNTRCTGIEGLDDSPIGDGIHGDFFQNQGSDNLGSFVLDTVTYYSSSNGITLHEWNGAHPEVFSMRRVNYGWDPRYDDDDRYEISGLAFTGHGDPVALESVYLDDPRGLNYGIISGQRVGAFELPGFIRQVDGVYEGPPPVGDFAPSQLTGLEYVSPFSTQ